MNIETAYILVLAIGIIMTVGAVGWNPLTNPVLGDNEGDLKKYKDIEHLYHAIDNGKFDDNNINWNHFKNSPVFENATSKIQHCIVKAEHLGDNLADYEIYDCYKKFDKD